MSEKVTITLGAITLKALVEGSDIGSARYDFGTVSSPLTSRPEQTLGYVSEQRQWSGVVKIEGVASLDESAADNKVRQAHNLALEVAKSENVLTITGANRTTPTVFRVRRNDPLSFPWDYLYEYGDEALLPLVLNVDPWSEGASVTQTIATSLATPNVIDLDVDGEEPTPLDLTVTRGFAGSGLQTLIVGRIPADVDLADMLHLAMDSSAPNWDAYTATSGYVNDDNNVLVNDTTTWRAMYWDALPAGRYALYAKTRVRTGGKGWLAQSRSSNDQSAASVSLADNDWRFVKLGDYASDGYTALRIIGKCREANKGILVDWLLAVPLTYGSPFYFHCTTLAVTSLTTTWLEASLQTTGGANRSARRYVSGPGVKALGAARLVIAACDANGAIRQPSVSASETHVPRFTHWIPAPEV